MRDKQNTASRDSAFSFCELLSPLRIALTPLILDRRGFFLPATSHHKTAVRFYPVCCIIKSALIIVKVVCLKNWRIVNSFALFFGVKGSRLKVGNFIHNPELSCPFEKNGIQLN